MRARIFGMIVVALLGAFQSAAAGPIDDTVAAAARAAAIQKLRPLAERAK